MIKAVLLDLDNTLLYNPDMAFAKAFIDLFERHFVNAGFETPAVKLRQAIKLMSAGQQGTHTNLETLASTLSSEREDTRDVLESFYTDIFPQLEPCISPVRGASDLIHHLRDMDIAIVIATNPIYPHRAIIQRMEWANLPVDESLYSLVTSADNMHFAKPDPAYYAEILGRVGIEPDEAIMVGDSKRNDISPAKQVGLHTCHITDGNLSHFTNNMDRYFDLSLPVHLRPDMIEPQLRGNIGAIHGFVSSVPEHFWHQRPQPDEWSIVQILCHLVSFEEENERHRLLTILQEENPFITQPEEPGPDIEACADEGLSVAHAFSETRQQTIGLIQTFTDEDWKRTARHSIFGLTTMLEMAYFTAQHDRLHLNQLCQTIGRCE